MKKRHLQLLLGVVMALVMTAFVTPADAYQFYSDDSGAVGDGTQNCAVCHGEFRSGTYVPPSGAPAWASHLHAGHQSGTTITSDCDNCHGGVGTTQRGVNLSSSGASPSGLMISCVGCHGRGEDAGNDAISSGYGAGLRQHHETAGVATCFTVGCHTDNAASYTPAPENTMPVWYPFVTNLVSGTLLEPCNANGEENFESSPLGNDNDGNGLYDTLDPACAPPEDCFNGVDDSGNGLVDCEDPECAGATNGACDTGNLGVCQAGTLTCDDPNTPLASCVQDVMAMEESIAAGNCADGDDNDCNGLTDLADPQCVVAGEEICFNGIDDSGNGLVDCEDPACFNVANSGEVCDSGQPGECQAGTPICNDTGASPLPDCVQDNQPVNELCDGLDNDCNGIIDNGFPVGDQCTAGVGACETTGSLVCTADGSGTVCDAVPGTPSTEGPQGDATCSDTIDNDCDGLTDVDDPNCSVVAPSVPPVNQNLGIMDVDFNNLMEDDCRVCHGDNPPPGVPVDPTYLPDRHHLLVNTAILPNPSVDLPNPDADGDGSPDTTYDCLNCHSMVFDSGTGTWELDPNFRDCLECHVASPHHVTAEATAGDCQACHGSLVDNGLVDADSNGQPDVFNWLPTYQPSLVTPYPGEMDMKPNGGEVNPNNSVPQGNCQYCHDEGSIDGLSIQLNSVNHHNTGFFDQGKCDWCHSADIADPNDPRKISPIRTCENCHGIPSVHNIQAKSDGTPADGTITPGAENPYFGHIGSNTDCNGCHGFTAASAPGSGPVIPQIASVSPATATAGQAVTLTITGQALTNLVPNPMGGEAMLLTSDLVLEAADGTETLVTASAASESSMTVDMPALAAGNYSVRAKKAQKSSNPIILPILPAVTVDSATCSNNSVTLTGSGFGSYIEATDAGTSVSATVTTGKGKDKTTTTEVASISSWNASEIVADFSSCPSTVDVFSVFGSAAATISGGTEPPTGNCADYSDEASCSADSACAWSDKKGGSCKAAGGGGGGGKPPKDK